MMTAGDLLWRPFGAQHEIVLLKILSWSQLYLVLFMMSFLFFAARGGVQWPIGKSARALFFPVFLLTVCFLFSVLLSLDRKMSVETSAYYLSILFTAGMLSFMLDDPDLLESAWTACTLGILYLSFKVILWRLNEGLGAGAFLVNNNAWVGKLQIAWVLNFFAPFLFARFLLKDGWKSALAGLAWAETGTAIFILFSRAGTLMFILSTAALCVLQMKQWKKWAPLAAAMLVGIVLAAAASPKMSRYVVRSSAQFFVDGGVERRMKIWEDTLKMVRAHPLTGTGLGTYDEVAFSQYSAPYGHWTDAQFRRRGWHAHNVHLHILAETGIIGFLAWVYFLFSLIAFGIRKWRENRTPGSRVLAESFLLTLGCFLALSMTESLIAARVHQSFRMNLTLALLVILTLSSIRAEEKSGRKMPKMVELP